MLDDRFGAKPEATNLERELPLSAGSSRSILISRSTGHDLFRDIRDHTAEPLGSAGNRWASSRLVNAYSMTSSAAARSAGARVTPISLAVLRLRIVENLVGFWTGRSAGRAPFKMRST